MAVLAEGYFRDVSRKHPNQELRSWAIERNGRLRVFGLYGDAAARDAFVQTMPEVYADFSCGDTTNGFACRVDTPIGDEVDVLFELPEDFSERPHASPDWRRGRTNEGS